MMGKINHGIKGMMTVFIILLGIILIGCTSSRKDELNKSLQKGENLLQEEKYAKAYELYMNLFEEYQDNLTIMEKIDYSKMMKTSRENLALAKEMMVEEDYPNVLSYLEKLSEQDLKALEEKTALIKKIKDKYLEKAEFYLSEKSYDIAIGILEEYERLVEEDSDIQEMMVLVKAESQKPEEIPKKVIVIDPAHQKNPNAEKEPIAPGSDVMRDKATVGTQGIETEVPEYIVTLDVAKSLKIYLEEAGYLVYLTRENHEVNLGNQERSQFANEMKADLFIRLHGNSHKESSKSGIEILYPSAQNSQVGIFSLASEGASKAIHEELLRATGGKSQGISARENMPEHNFSKGPVITLLMGFMTNPDEDHLLQSKEYQQKVVEGIKNGISRYFQGS